MSRWIQLWQSLRTACPGFDKAGLETEFLPAALEVVETPPSPLGRALLWTILGIAALSLLWAGFGQIDIVATARGRIVPSGQVKVVQSLEPAVVRQILVSDGQPVTAGQVLIELDPTEPAADQARLTSELAEAKIEAARWRALATTEITGTISLDPQVVVGLPAIVIARHQAQMVSAFAEHRAKLANLAQDYAQKIAERASSAAALAKITEAMPPLRRRAEIRRGLAEAHDGSLLTSLELEQQVIEAVHAADQESAHLQQLDAALSGLKQAAQATRQGFLAEAQAKLLEAEQHSATLTQDLAKASAQLGRRHLTAPVNGTIQQLAVHSPGGVVSPAEVLLVVVPDGDGLEIAAALDNADIGFVSEGQPAEIKVDAFPFTRYGLKTGRVLALSRDVVSQLPQSGVAAELTKPSQHGATAGNEPTYYAVRLSLDDPNITAEGRRLPLTAGMAVTAEIKTGRRSILDYLLSPVAAHLHDGLRER